MEGGVYTNSNQILNNLDKKHVYCYRCFKENIINKLDFQEENNIYKICDKHRGKNFKTLRWCKDSNTWHCFYGIGKDSICQSCVLSKRNKSPKMIEISKENGKLYGSQNMINNHKKYDYKMTCRNCKNFECQIRNNSDNKEHVFLNNSCIDKMLPSEVRSKNATENAKKNWEKPEYAKKIAQNLGNYLGNPDWAREIGVKGREALEEIFKNDSNFGKKIISEALKYLNQHPEIRQECGKKNIIKAKEAQLQAIQESITKLDLVITENSIDVFNIQKLRKHDICGVYAIKAKFKKDKDTDKENNIYNLLVCKSIKVYDEIYWVLRVLSNTEKQDKNNPNWTIAKWWYITNLYYDFEFILLTDSEGVNGNIALLSEAKFGLDNNMICNKKQIIKDGFSQNHSYWNI